MTRLQNRWWVVAPSLALLLITSGSALSVLRARGWGTNDSVGQPSQRPLAVSVMVLGSLDPPFSSESYRGVVTASKEAELAFRRSGRIESIDVVEGSRVQRGDRLASLESESVLAQVASAQAAVDEAEAVLGELIAGPRRQTIEAAEAEVRRLTATVDLASSTVARQISLMRANASSPQQYDDATSALDQQRAALTAAEQRLQELREGTRPEQIAAQRARIETLRETHGKSVPTPEALAVTVSGCTRHIVATTMTTAAGFTPLILGGGESDRQRRKP